MTAHGAIAHLPEACFALAPELRDLQPPSETIADCANCPMARQPHEPDPPSRAVFDIDLRCCTFHPVLYNYLAGRALRRGDAGTESVRARIAELEGVTRWAIRPPQRFHDAVARTGAPGFGTDPDRRCPFWGPENGKNCTIWRDRNAVCRTWFCRHVDGKKGRAFWYAQRDLVRVLQVKLCRWLGDEVDPGADPQDADGWCAFYVACADRLDAATPEELAALQDAGLGRARERVAAEHRALHTDDLPEVVGPCVTAFHPRSDHVVLEGYSHYNPRRWPREIFTLFSLMDGTMGWREALVRCAEILGEERFTEADVRELYRLGMVEARVPADLAPGARLHGVPADWVGEAEQELVEIEWSWTDPADPNPG